MSESSSDQENAQLQRQNLSLASLYLDPNNYRFIDHPDYRKIGAEHVFDEDVQRRTTRFLLGRSQENVSDLIASFQENGWLDFEPVLVRREGKGRYLVIEGNRRVATLQHLQRRHADDAIDLGQLDPALFKRVPVVLYADADERHHLVMMGLHHISGKRRWPAINRAEAMLRLYKELGRDADAVCRALGVSKRELNLSLRTLTLAKSYRESDYGDQFKPEQFNLFREVLKGPAIRDWIGWDPESGTAKNTNNLERFFSWISTEPEDVEDADPEGLEHDVPAMSEPALKTARDIRDLAKIIEDPKAVKRFEETRSLQEATLSSDLLLKNEIDRAMESCNQAIQRLLARANQLGANHLDDIEVLTGKLQGIALAGKRRPQVSGRSLPWQPFNEITQSRFRSISVERYRGLIDLEIAEPRRINVIVGVNNAGKTSLLEAIYLLAHQNDERALLDLIRWRGRIEGEPEPLWVVDQLPKRARILGNFGDVGNRLASVEIETHLEPDDDIEDQTSFLARLDIEAEYVGRRQSTEVVFFEDRPRRTNFQGQNALCRSAFTSPFSANRPETLARCNKASLAAGSKEKVVDFIRKRIDSKLRNIELADRFNRFLVSHQEFEKAPDLATFGEGVRRIFEIGLLFADVQGGVVLIDELENAIHTGLLHAFTRFILELAVEMDVQVFLSTHSKETLDAFLIDEDLIKNVAGYAMLRGEGRITVRRYSGEQLRRLDDAVDFDLRGLR